MATKSFNNFQTSKPDLNFSKTCLKPLPLSPKVFHLAKNHEPSLFLVSRSSQIQRVRVWTPQCEVIGRLGQLLEDEGKCAEKAL